MLLKQLPSRKNLGSNWADLGGLIDYHLTDVQQHHRLLDSLATDRGYLLGMYRAPAAKGNHHAFEGGLVFHLLEMWFFWQEMWRPTIEQNEYINDERILKGIIYHDLHKAYRTFELKSYQPWQTDYAREYTDQMMTNTIKNIWLLMREGIDLDVQQMNALCWAEGGFSEIKPKQCSVLAKVLYLIDETSGNVRSRIDDRTYLELRKPVP